MKSHIANTETITRTADMPLAWERSAVKKFVASALLETVIAITAVMICGVCLASATSTDQAQFPTPSNQAKSHSKPGPPSDIDGTWLGTVEAGGIRLRVVFHILNTADGLTATMDSPDQGVNGVPATSVRRNGSSLKIEVKQMRGGAFEGKISPDLAKIAGTYSWTGGTLPLVVQRVKDASALERRRPQNPVKPYPYREEEVSYVNKSAQGVTLAGTLTLPPGKGPFVAVLLVPGSGPHDRDETLLGHKPFLVLADYLTRKGIVVLRVDDRGVGESTGSRADATSADFATDAEAGIAYLKTRPEVDSHKIGLIGHSEGRTHRSHGGSPQPRRSFHRDDGWSGRAGGRNPDRAGSADFRSRWCEPGGGRKSCCCEARTLHAD
jgi:hypothetical protein